MSYAQQAAEQAFKKAQQDLEAALEKFTIARDEFSKVSGKFIAADTRLINSFNQVAIPVEKDSGGQALAQY